MGSFLGGGFFLKKKVLSDVITYITLRPARLVRRSDVHTDFLYK
jgi:hypothetical protein